MNDTLVTVVGNLVEDPVERLTRADLPFVTFRLASTARRLDASAGRYVDTGTNFMSVTAFRSLARNAAASLKKGHPVIVHGRLRVNQWTKGERSGTSVEIDAYTIGHDLTKGASDFVRSPRTLDGGGRADGAAADPFETAAVPDYEVAAAS